MKKIVLYGMIGAVAAAVILLKPKEALCLERPLLVAHRGANKLADENTLKAYALAAEHGMDYFECDPRLTADGVFVIMHDSDVNRTTDGKGKIEEMTLEQVKSLRTKSGEQVPTLAEALALAKEKGVGVYLDTKLKEIADLEKLAAAVREAGMADRVVMGLWNREGQAYMNEHHPDIATSVAYPLAAAGAKDAKKIGAEWIGTIVPQATPGLIRKCEKYGLKLVTLPINDPAVMVAKMKAGIQVLQTDDAPLLKKTVDEFFEKVEAEKPE